MKVHAWRLRPGQDVRLEIEKYVRDNRLQAGAVLACVGSVQRATLRMADERIVKDYENNFEIVSLTGTVSSVDSHLHISLSDADGQVIGGHMKPGCLVYTTTEVVLAEFDGMRFDRQIDKETGFEELVVENVSMG